VAVSCKHAGLFGAMFVSPSTFVCSFCEADDLRAQVATLRAELVAARDRIPPERFPILGGPSVPWSLVAPHELQARNNHDQSLRRLAERGGLSPGELWCIVHDKKWREQPDEKTALAWLRAWAGIGVEGACDQLRAQLAAVRQEAHDQRDQLEAERDQARMEAHRLRTENQAVDVHHIRLRDGLRRACDGYEQLWRSENNGDLPECLDVELRELRALL
jgi:hypothetical protein